MVFTDRFCIDNEAFNWYLEALKLRISKIMDRKTLQQGELLYASLKREDAECSERKAPWGKRRLYNCFSPEKAIVTQKARQQVFFKQQEEVGEAFVINFFPQVEDFIIWLKFCMALLESQSSVAIENDEMILENFSMSIIDGSVKKGLKLFRKGLLSDLAVIDLFFLESKDIGT